MKMTMAAIYTWSKMRWQYLLNGLKFLFISGDIDITIEQHTLKRQTYISVFLIYIIFNSHRQYNKGDLIYATNIIWCRMQYATGFNI